jgi:hypothetical protein
LSGGSWKQIGLANEPIAFDNDYRVWTGGCRYILR